MVAVGGSGKSCVKNTDVYGQKRKEDFVDTLALSVCAGDANLPKGVSAPRG